MPNIAVVLKSEMSRLARKELKGDLETLKKAVAAHRHELATVKKRIQELERQLKRAVKAAGAATPKGESAEQEGKPLRFSPSRFAAQRQKLGLSAADFAKLLGVSSLSVYKWEKGETRPRQAQLQAIAAARGLGKREAAARLEKLAA